MDVCMNAASKPVLAEFKSMSKCFTHTCHGKICKSGDQKCLGDCMWSRCAGFAIKCNADNKTGFKTCDTAFQCFDTCKGDDAMNCLTKCYQGLSKSAQADFDGVWNCIGKSAAKDPFGACLAQVLECTSAGQSGKNTCLEMAMCADDCDSKKKPGDDGFACTSKCYAQGTKTAQGEYKKLLACFSAFDGGSGDPKVCSSGMVGCIKPKGTKTCPEIDPCGKACQKTGKAEGACTFECLHKASPAEATKFVELMVCVGSKCDAKCKGSTDPKCGDKCLQNECKTEMLACLS